MSLYHLEDVLHEAGNFFVLRVKKGYEVYECGVTHAVRRGIFGRGQQYLDRAIAYAEQRAAERKTLAAQQFAH